MTPADTRVLEMLDRWLVSIELHIKYLDLDDASYRQVQSWPEHERPARWILELAQQKVLQLKTLCKAQIASNDNSFSESLELMGFLANLVGMQNIQRFIPLADPASEQTIKPAPEKSVAPSMHTSSRVAPTADNATRELPKIKATAAQGEGEHTREMPTLKVVSKKPVTRNTADASLRKAASKSVASQPPVLSTPAHSNGRIQEIVVADAVRLLKWGREWHELTELIARMAERPAAAEIRRILRTHKLSIEAQLL